MFQVLQCLWYSWKSATTLHHPHSQVGMRHLQRTLHPHKDVSKNELSIRVLSVELRSAEPHWFHWKMLLFRYGFYLALLSLKLYSANQQTSRFWGFRYLIDMKVTQMHTFNLGPLCFRWRLRVWMRRLSPTHSTRKEQHFLMENLLLYEELLRFRECRCFTTHFCIEEIQLSPGRSPLSTSYSVCNCSQPCKFNTNHALHPSKQQGRSATVYWIFLAC